ncbi:50S ribosomal protein L10 [Collinsella intestinalis]|uniref:50S ribosomal protein L10 n=1 Tax=Collinsella intestinalis TaxID=147207 RepID=UPI00195BA23B|nr:50S ribosomal protein L10 [Collinsella intestinalis]MBM6907346.1 50S ribosomal protein L10 [Collinsella intestinalis]MBM6942728.1 50S ribosomal protein L10 [Collinsella intestinalis]HIU05381.1 50S ribosomal protein L10 [Candidatus Coprousia avicola]
MPAAYKIEKVAEIEQRVEANNGVFVVNYRGLTVKQSEDLRHKLREAGAEMKVYKNNLVRLALKNQEQPEIDDILVGPVAYVFYENEPVESAKVLKEFAQKSKGVLEIRGGISEGKAVTAEEVNAIADLPTKDQLLGQIAGLINGFARDIAVCVNGVSSGLARQISQISEQKAA